MTRELVSMAYRLDVSENEWLRGVFEVLRRACPGESGIAKFSGGELKVALGDSAFLNHLSFEIIGPEIVGCSPLDAEKEVRRWLCWLISGNEYLVYICSVPIALKCPNWHGLSHVLRPALNIRTALSEIDVDSPVAAGDLRSNLNQMILQTDIVAQMLENPLPPLVRTVWDGVLTGTWSLIDVQSAPHGWNVVAHRNAEGYTDPRALSTREQDVLRLMALGLSNKEIGYRMGISASSVASFMRRAMEKMHVESRVQLVAIAGVLGIPDFEASKEPVERLNMTQIAAEIDELLSSLNTPNIKKSDIVELRKRLKQLSEIAM